MDAIDRQDTRRGRRPGRLLHPGYVPQHLAPRRRMGAVTVTLVVALGSLAVTLLGMVVQTGSLASAWAVVTRMPALLPLNWLPVALLAATLTLACANPFGALAATEATVGLLNLANRVKVEARGEPLVPGDLLLAREGIGAAGEYDLDLHPGAVILIALAFAALVAAAVALRGRGVGMRRRRRLAVAVACAGASCLALAATVGSADVYQRSLDGTLDAARQYDLGAVSEALGFNYAFLHMASLTAVPRPAGYDAREVEAQIASYLASPRSDETGLAARGVRPNVLFVMCESFSDVSDGPAFAFTAASDPLAAYKRVRASTNALASGHIIVPGFGGGTANTEFDVTTGMQTEMLGGSETTAFYTVRGATGSLFRVADGQGYATSFLHPGHDWFYDRRNVYPRLGVGRLTFDEAFDDGDRLGGWVTDDAFLRRLQSSLTGLFERGDQPVLAYGVTIQNHLQYTYDKYVYEGAETYAPVPLRVSVSDTSMEALAVYLRGVRDGAQMLENLCTTLNATDEPTVVAFFGDHRPALGASFSAYRELGMRVGADADGAPADVLDTYAVPFVVWANDAYLREVDPAAVTASLDLPASGTISANYLGEVVYELAGLSGTDPYFDFLADARRAAPVIGHGVYALPDGTLVRADEARDAVEHVGGDADAAGGDAAPDATLLAEARARAAQLRAWEYYRLRDERL